VDTHEKRTVVTGDSGQYTFTLLKPNRYSLVISRSGFKKSTINTFSLAAGDRARARILRCRLARRIKRSR
jgi:hypothetical protein